MIAVKFAKRLRELREERGMKRSELAGLVGYSYTTVYQWEHDTCRADYDTLAILADIFYTTTDYLIGITDERSRR